MIHGAINKKGFTLIEVMIAVGIVSLIMGTVLFNYSAFNDDLALSAAGQEIAIAVREAQTYGLTVKEAATGGGQFNYAYGIVFDPSNSPTGYLVFVDSNANKKYDAGNGCGSGATECVEQFALRNGMRVTGVCDASGTCPPGVSNRILDVTFLRPNPDSYIALTDLSGNIVSGPSNTGKVVVTSPKGTRLVVTIESTGQVLVK
jgi:prepilin-type N-terminal cleavage/methylation domain-containing protein